MYDCKIFHLCTYMLCREYLKNDHSHNNQSNLNINKRFDVTTYDIKRKYVD